MFTTPLPTLTLDPEMGFSSGTRIHTKEGLKPIESILAGDWVLTHPEQVPPPNRRRQRSEWLYRQVTRAISIDVPSLLRISLQNMADGIEDTLLVAAGQPIWTQPAGWLAARDVRAGHAVVLSFNGNALVQKVQPGGGPARVYCLEVEDCRTYYVEQLGAWVGSNSVAVQTVPARPAQSDFDFSKPQVLLEIKNYYNDTLAEPEPRGAQAPALAEQMRAAAEKLRSAFKEQMQQDLSYDEEGVRRLNAYIDRARQRPSTDQWKGVIRSMGAFLGECTIRNLGGQWSRREDAACVVLSEGSIVFPHAKVAAQFASGAQGDSILDFYRSSMSLKGRLVADSAVAEPVASPGTSMGRHFVDPMPPQPQMEQVLHKLRSSYESRRQRMSSITLASLAGPRPSWVKETDGLAEFFAHQEVLLTEGQVVWGALVQANSLLFKPGEANCPGLLVHSSDHYFDSRPQELQLIGRTFFSLKNTEPADAELKEVARLVTDEVDRSMGFELPKVFSSKPVRSATFMVFRKHVPNGVLSGSLFPILAHPSTQAVMMVPFEFWPIELIVLWKEGKI